VTAAGASRLSKYLKRWGRMKDRLAANEEKVRFAYPVFYSKRAAFAGFNCS
jgi:hypothetical protein